MRHPQVDQSIDPDLAAKVRELIVGAVLDGELAPGECRLLLAVFDDGPVAS